MIVTGRRAIFSSGLLLRRLSQKKLGRGKAKRASIATVLFILPVLMLSSEKSVADGWLGGDADNPTSGISLPTQAPNKINDNKGSGARGAIGGIANTRRCCLTAV